MDNLIDYIQWMGDFPIPATGFRDADALVLCMLSYFDLAQVFEGGRTSARVRDCQCLIDTGNVQVEIPGRNLKYPEILQAAVRSRRFGDLKMTDYADILWDQPPLQFSAVCFHDEEDLSFLAFRGTDSSLAGWREDFMISFSHTEAQELAKKYAEARIMPGRRWMIGGHSKGGNLGLYVACMMSEEQLSGIEKIFILDAPGLCPDVIDPDCLNRIEPRITRIIPEFSIVGKLFEPQISDSRIVRSSAHSFLQHDLSTWGVDHGKLALAEHNDPVSCWINEVLDQWIGDISREERIVFVNEVFDALSAGGARTLEDLPTEGWKGYELIRQRFQGASETTKRILADLPRQAMINSLSSLHQKNRSDS